MTSLEAIEAIERMCREAREHLYALPATHLGDQPIPEEDRGELHHAKLVLYFSKIRKLSGEMSVQVAEEVIS